jgi:hypothetical protein
MRLRILDLGFGIGDLGFMKGLSSYFYENKKCLGVEGTMPNSPKKPNVALCRNDSDFSSVFFLFFMLYIFIILPNRNLIDLMDKSTPTG